MVVDIVPRKLGGKRCLTGDICRARSAAMYPSFLVPLEDSLLAPAAPCPGPTEIEDATVGSSMIESSWLDQN